MNSDRSKKAKVSFFMAMGLVAFLAVFIGFGKTLPPAIKDFHTPFILYVHGAFAFGWLCLFFIQATLIRYDNFQWHKKLGFLGIFIAAGTALTLFPAGVYDVQKDLRNGSGEVAYSNMISIITTAIMYLTLVVWGILSRKTPQTHKRLMLLATILILWPAWFRFRHYFPSVPKPEIWFSLVLPNSLIVIFWIWDKYVNRKLHPVLIWAGAFIVAEQTFEIIMFDSEAWRLLGKQIFLFLTV